MEVSIASQYSDIYEFHDGASGGSSHDSHFLEQRIIRKLLSNTFLGKDEKTPQQEVP
jgi:hypothetical protein